MATTAELEDALRNADAAGDADAARQLADALVEARGQGAPERQKPGALERLGNYGEGLLDSFTNTFGVIGDELTAHEAALAGRKPGGGTFDIGNYDVPYWDRYDRALAAERAQNKQFAQDYPVQDIAAKGAGMLLNPAVGAAGRWAVNAPNMAGKILRSGVAAGGVGAAYGAAEGEGGFQKRMANALAVGAPSAAIGAAVPPVAAGLSKGGGWARDRIVRALAGESADKSIAGRKLAETAMQQFPKLTPEQAVTQATRRALRHGDDAALLDAGPRFNQLAGDTARQGGAPGTTIDEFLVRRQAGRLAPSGRMTGGQAERVSGVLDDAAGGRTSGIAAQRSLKAAQKAAKDPLYKATANDPSKLVPKDKFAAAVSDEPGIGEQIAKVKADKWQKLSDLPDNSLPVVDAAQKRMSDLAGKAYRKGATHEGDLISAARRKLVAAADDAFPDYAKARDVWRDFKGVMDADDLGRKFMRGDVDVLEDAVSRMKPEELAQFRAGAAAALKTAAQKTKGGGDVVNKLFGTRDAQNRARIAFGREYRKHLPRIVAEGEKFKAFSEAFGNSKTAERLARMERAGIDPGELAGAAFDVKTGNVPGLALRAAKALKPRGILGPPEPVRMQMARALTGQDPSLMQQGMGAARLADANKKALARALMAGGVAAAR